MKYVRFEQEAAFKTTDIIEAALRYGGERGITFDAMRKRQRLWGVIDSNKDPNGVTFEDADFELLVNLVRATPFAAATRELHSVVEALLESKPPEAVESKAP